MRQIDPQTREQVRRALEGDSNDAEHDALAAIAEALRIDWYPDEQRQELVDALSAAGEPRLAEQVRAGESIANITVAVQDAGKQGALALIEHHTPQAVIQTTPPAGPTMTVELLGEAEGDDDGQRVLTRHRVAGDSATFGFGDEHGGPHLSVGSDFHAYNDRVNPGLWVDRTIYEASGFTVHFHPPT